MESALHAVQASDNASVRKKGSHRWRIWDDRDFYTAGEGVARDAMLGRSVAIGAAPTYRLWQNEPALIVSRQDMRLPNFAVATEWMNKAGWPVVMRDTGGTAVPVGPGVLNISLVLPRSLVVSMPGYAMDAVYRLLCDPVQRALESFDVPTVFGSVPGAFCDGRFNLVAERKKIAGTAQVWRANVALNGTNREGYVLAHAALLVDVDPQEVTELVNRFYSMAGKAGKFDHEEIISLRHCIASGLYPRDKSGGRSLMKNIRSCIRSSILRMPGPVTFA